MRRFTIAILLALFAFSCVPSATEACPMCKVANEDAPVVGANGQTIDPNAKPRAYMYSILFMISMPVLLLSGFSVAFIRMARREAHMIEMGPDGNRNVGLPTATTTANT